MNYIIIGYPCSGKTTAREFIQSQLQCVGYEASSFAIKAVDKYHTNDIVELHSKRGKHIVAEEICHMIDSSFPFVISGFRTNEEILYMHQHYNIFAISIMCSFSVIKRRMILRNRECDNLGERLKSDRDLGLQQAIESADISLNNIQDMKSLNRQLIDILRLHYDLP